MHPYRNYPDRQFWNRAVSTAPWAEVFLDQPAKFQIAPEDRIASAGSCFARRIAEHLLAVGYNYELFEPCHPLIEAKAEAYGYGAFSCRYGNIYTTRQLRQLFDEALGLRPAIFRFAELAPGAVIDLMRPNVSRTGLGSVEEAKFDRLHHLTRVRRMIEEMDLFVFTLGLTEAWADEAADIVYGSHPGVFVNDLRAEHIAPVNLEYETVVQDLEYVLALIARHNRNGGGVRVVLTVSPVGLAATHQAQHVITATTYSKSVLRAAAGKLAASHAKVDYFPSYEIFSLSQSFGQFLADDLREVNPRGVRVAMDIFDRMFLQAEAPPKREPAAAPPPAAVPAETSNPADAECDEVANAYFGDRG
jgi:hypothetical protein